LRSGKNLVGAFHQPIGVLCDFETIATLPERERVGGLGEVAKCWLLEGGFAAELNDVSLHDLIVMSVTLKAAIVSADEHEGGRRALLNYGHTLAHASRKWRWLATVTSYAMVKRSRSAWPSPSGWRRRWVGSTTAKWCDTTRCWTFWSQSSSPEDFRTSSLLEAMAHDKRRTTT